MARPPVRRLLFIVSPQRMDLYEALRTALWSEMDCEIIVDRRKGERRQAPSGGTPRGGPDRRGAQRRQRTLVDREIRECGWAVVNISLWAEETVDRFRRG
jgi:hypothetical protein